MGGPLCNEAKCFNQILHFFICKIQICYNKSLRYSSQ